MINIGLIGGGVVGGGIINILNNIPNEKKIVNISKICIRNIDKNRDWVLPLETKLTTDPYDIINDQNIDMVVEVMGGVDLAKEVIFESIKRGKDIVTANKALVSLYLEEIEDLVDKHKGGIWI